MHIMQVIDDQLIKKIHQITSYGKGYYSTPNSIPETVPDT